MRVEVSIEQFKETLNSLIGNPLSAATVTRGDQSHLVLSLGRMTRVQNRIPSLHCEGEEDPNGPPVRIGADNVGPAELDQYVGEVALAVWCNWRIEKGEAEIVCGSQDYAEEGKPIQSAIREMMGDTVADVSLNSFFDLLVVFNGGKRLRLFCDQNGHENDDNSYQLCTVGGQVYGVITGLIELVNGG